MYVSFSMHPLRPVCLLAMVAACSGSGGPQSADGGPGGMPDTEPALDPERVARGAYLVDHVALCADCHTPRKADGSLDMDRYLAGVTCFRDTAPANDTVGCLHTPNLTNHPSGLMHYTDEEIETMFREGRARGHALIPIMPYWVYHNMADADAGAIVAYLRTVPGVAHALPAHQAPWEAPPEPATPVDPATIPAPPADAPDRESAMRGRYLAAMAGVCMECHTPPLPGGSLLPRPIDMDRPFAGGRGFALPMPPFDRPNVVAPNLTPHFTGLVAWDAEDVADAIALGLEKTGGRICPPMPVGPMGLYGGLTARDVVDIANYIVSLPPVENQIASTCTPPGP